MLYRWLEIEISTKKILYFYLVRFIYQFNILFHKMRKIIRKVGDSTGIIFNKEERQIYNLGVGKILEITFKEVKESDN